MLAGKKGEWRHEELKRFKADEAHQGVAVDAEHFYAITNAAIGKYRKDTGERVGTWKDAKADGHIKHLNAGMVLDGKLWCAHSNYPEMPMKSSVEVFDPKTMQHLESIDLTDAGGSLTWVDRRDGWWYACFAQYAKTGDPARTRVVRFDLNWKPLPRSASRRDGGEVWQEQQLRRQLWPDRHLFITGHDAQELYVLDLPVTKAMSGLGRRRFRSRRTDRPLHGIAC
jgi:hypothetical protein